MATNDNERPMLHVQLIIVVEHFALSAFDGLDADLGNALKDMVEQKAGDPRYASLIKATYTTPAAQMIRDGLTQDGVTVIDADLAALLAKHAEAIEKLYDLVPARSLLQTAA